MSNEKKLGQDPAYPIEVSGDVNGSFGKPVIYSGISKRMLLAGMAMQGMLAHSTRYKPLPNYPENWHDAIAQEAFELADSLLRQEGKDK